MVSQKTSKHGGRLKLRILDISRAQFYGLSRRPVYTNLPPGREVPGKCAKLLKTMYGTQDASSVWQETYTKLLEEHGIVHGTAWPAIFDHEPTDSRFLCHGDDFVVLADSKGQQFVEDALKKKFEFRVDGSIGPDACDGTSMTVLNRILEFDRATGKVRYEADPRHAETVFRQLNLADAKPVATPAEKVSAHKTLAASGLPPLPADRASLYRSVVMRCAYLSQDRVDICESVKSLARFMASPTEHSWGKLKRLGRYLKGCPRVIQEFCPQDAYNSIVCYTDSDHAGCLFTRKSTSGVVCMAGKHWLKTSSTVQFSDFSIEWRKRVLLNSQSSFSWTRTTCTVC